MNKILLAAAIGSASLSFNASALEIIGGPSASDNGYQIAHQKSRYQQGINVLDLTNRDGIVSTVNYGDQYFLYCCINQQHFHELSLNFLKNLILLLLCR